MMKLLTVMLLSSLFVGANFEAVADGIDPEIEVFENYEYVKTFYKKGSSHSRNPLLVHFI